MFSGVPLALVGSWLAHRGSFESWPAFVRRTLDWHTLALVWLVALGVQFEDAHGVTTDGVIYFSQLRSVLFDRDLDVAAEFAFLGQPPRPYHVVPIGPTLVWLPLYLAVAGVDALGRGLGLWLAPQDPIGIGLTLPYVRAALVSSFAIGVIGLCVVHQRLRDEFGPGRAFMATLLLFAATPLLWYMVYEPSMTHAASFGFVAIFVTLAARWSSVQITSRQSVVLGALLGLAFITRPQEAVFALFPALLLFTSPGPLAGRTRSAIRLAAWALLGAAPFLALQAAHSTVLFARESFALVGANGYIDLLHSRWADTLWSSWHGFLSWTPMAYVAVLGTAIYLTRNWRWALATLVIVLVMAWVNGSTADWAAGWSFGGRRFTSILVLLAPGLAFMIDQLARRPMISIALMATLVVTWNQLLLIQYSENMLPTGVPVSFAQIVRQQASVLTRPPFFYPFAFPANAWFAWQTGLPIDRYDLLGPEPLRPSLDLPLDADAGKFLLEGWGPRAADEWGDLRWIDTGTAELVVPLAISSADVLDLQVVARSRLVEPPVRGVMALTINGQRVGTFSPGAAEPSTSTLSLPTDSLRRGFNRIRLEQVGIVDATGATVPADRPLPVAVYRLQIKPARD